jgi:uncharacterized protein YggE
MLPRWYALPAAVALVGGMTFAGLHFGGGRPTPVAAAQTLSPGSGASLSNTITVQGTGTAMAAPDIAYITAGAQTQASTAKAAADANSTVMTAVIAALKAQNVAAQDIQTSNYSLDPVYAQSTNGGGSQTITGYRVSNDVRVTVENVNNVGNVLDAAVGAGANADVSIDFDIKDASALEQQALTGAVQQAAAKANAVASAGGVKLAGIAAISEEGVNPPTPIVRQELAASAAPSTPVEQGQLSVQATVVVSYNYSH